MSCVYHTMPGRSLTRQCAVDRLVSAHKGDATMTGRNDQTILREDQVSTFVMCQRSSAQQRVMSTFEISQVN